MAKIYAVLMSRDLMAGLLTGALDHMFTRLSDLGYEEKEDLVDQLYALDYTVNNYLIGGIPLGRNTKFCFLLDSQLDLLKKGVSLFVKDYAKDELYEEACRELQRAVDDAKEIVWPLSWLIRFWFLAYGHETKIDGQARCAGTRSVIRDAGKKLGVMAKTHHELRAEWIKELLSTCRQWVDEATKTTVQNPLENSAKEYLIDTVSSLLRYQGGDRLTRPETLAKLVYFAETCSYVSKYNIGTFLHMKRMFTELTIFADLVAVITKPKKEK